MVEKCAMIEKCELSSLPSSAGCLHFHHERAVLCQVQKKLLFGESEFFVSKTKIIDLLMANSRCTPHSIAPTAACSLIGLKIRKEVGASIGWQRDLDLDLLENTRPHKERLFGW